MKSHQRSARYLKWVLKYRWVFFVVGVLLTAVSTWRTVQTYAGLRGDLEELLPVDAPSVSALDTLRARLPGLRHLGVVVSTGGPENVEAANAFIDDLASRIRKYPPTLVGNVRIDAKNEREFIETFAYQLMDPADVGELRESVEDLRDWHATRGMGMDLLDEDEDPKPVLPIDDLREKYEARHGNVQGFPGDRFVSADGETAVLLVQVGVQSSGFSADQDLLDRVYADVEELDFPDRYASGMQIGYAADVAAQVEELSGLVVDLSLSGAMVLLLVCACVAWFFRSFRSLWILFIPLFMGTVFSFGVVALPPLSILHLNSNTAFLGAIIVGNGINTGIILLARFQEERSRGRETMDALTIAISTTWRPTLAAALAASAAYGSLVFTDFRGFNQFGWIGGFGMILCWATTFLISPILISWWGAAVGRRAGSRGVTHGWSSALGNMVVRAPRAILLFCTAAIIFSIGGMVLRRSDWLENDFSKLRRRDSWTSGEVYWSKHMDRTLGTYLTPSVILASDANQAEAIEKEVLRLRDAGRAGGLIDRVRSIRTFLPPTSEEAREEAIALKNVITPKIRSELDEEQRRALDMSTSERALQPLQQQDIPPVMLTGLLEFDGQADRSVLIFPRLGEGTWDTRRALDFTNDLRAASKIQDKPAIASGSILLSSDILEAMRRDGPRTTAIALGIVLLVTLLALRSLWLSLGAILSLLLGVTVMLGSVAWMGEKINFANFVALPITFGIAADYSLNVLKRYQATGKRRVRELVSGTGGAVALCSATTIIGFGSLLVAQNQGLFSFGAFAVAGEVACLLTAVIALPAALVLINGTTESCDADGGDAEDESVDITDAGDVPPESSAPST